jgi:hypothetical protein
MGKRVLGLGKPAAGSANGITVSSSTNATPIVITLGAGHGLKNDDRIRITGITGNTNANGDWTLSNVGSTTATLVGSKGNGTHGGTAAVSVICDRTPFMAGKAAMVVFTAGVTAGSLEVEGSDDGTTFADLMTETTPLGGAVREIVLKRYMRSSGTSTTGTAEVALVAPH